MTPAMLPVKLVPSAIANVAVTAAVTSTLGIARAASAEFEPAIAAALPRSVPLAVVLQPRLRLP